MAAEPQVHFVGVAGSGMSALAQYHVMGGGSATGSDRAFDRGGASSLRAKLEALGIVVYRQDGAGIAAGPGRVVASAAVEKDNADLLRARAAGIEVVHRADWLSRYVAASKTIAVAGTSGKSTVTAMIYEILESAGRSPSVIAGGGLLALERRGLVGNAWRGASELLVIEADESDGTLTRYRPWLGILLNVERDHKELAELQELFGLFRGNCGAFVVNADAPALQRFRGGCRTFGLGPADVRGENVELGSAGSRFTVGGLPFSLPLPGRHNVENALAAAAACLEAGVGFGEAAKGLASYSGVARRFERVGAAAGVEVIDDFAHNPAKVRAALAAAHLRAGRVLAVFQPHGYAPTRFNRAEFIEAFVSALAPEDVLWLPEIYYAGGTAEKTISARDIAEPVAARGRNARFIADRKDIIPALAGEARPADLVLVMGARDPSLPEFAQDILKALIHRFSTSG